MARLLGNEQRWIGDGDIKKTFKFLFCNYLLNADTNGPLLLRMCRHCLLDGVYQWIGTARKDALIDPRLLLAVRQQQVEFDLRAVVATVVIEV